MHTLGIDPIAGDKPEGNDPKYEPSYEQMQGEIKKLSFVASGEGIQWDVVVSSAADVLQTVAKDISAASYLSIALGKTRGLSGWAEGTQILADLFRLWWETGYPPLNRLRARVNSLDWWQEQSLLLLVAWQQSQPYPEEVMKSAEQAVAALDAQIGERLPEHIPLHEIREALRRLPVVEPLSPDPEPVLDSASAIQVTTAPDPQIPPDQSSGDSVPNIADSASALAAFQELAGDVLGLLCCQPPASERLLWKIVATSLLGKIRVLPLTDGGQTAIPAPDPTPMNAVQRMLASGNPLGAVAAAVNFTPMCPLWLDVQRCLAEALEACGPEYAEARDVIHEECASLLHRLPGLETLQFADGTPFADTVTRTWLATLHHYVEQDPKQNDCISIAIQKSQKYIAQENYISALESLEKEIEGQEPLNRIRLQLEQIQLLCRCQRWMLATMLAEEVSLFAENYRMDEWNPVLASMLWQVVYTAWSGSAEEKGVHKAQEAFSHIVRLQPSAAFRIEKNTER